MKLFKRTSTPVDRGWIDTRMRHVAIDVTALRPKWSYDQCQAFTLINTMFQQRPDVIDQANSGPTVAGTPMIKLVIKPGRELDGAFATIAILWHSAAGRILTLTPGSPPTPPRI